MCHENIYKKNSYSRFELAERQLEAALALLAKEIDLIAVITLSGAADVILNKLVTQSGQKNFTEEIRDIENSKCDETKSLSQIGREVNDLCGINNLKHFDDDEDEQFELDIYESAIGSFSKAIANIAILKGADYKLVRAFNAWVMMNKHKEWVGKHFL